MLTRLPPWLRQIRFWQVVVAAVLMLGVALLSWARADAQTTLTVCPSGCDHTTIQAAIDAASDGDTISVAAGTYNETLVLNVANLTLSGPGTGTATIQPTSDPTPSRDIAISASGVTIEDFTLDFNGAGGTRGGNGIHVTNSGVTIRDNIILIGQGAGGVDSDGIGIDTTGDVTGLTIRDNVFSGVDGGTIGPIAVWINPVAGANVVIGPNNVYTLTHTDSGGFVAILSSDVTVSGNTATGPGANPALGTFGVNVGGGEDSIVVTGAAITGNTISNFGTGVDVFTGDGNGALTVSVTNNFIQNNTEGVFSGPDSTVTVTDNSITGNTDGVLETTADAVVAAANNWWGSASGPTHATNTTFTEPGGTPQGDRVSGNVTFLPWVNSGTDADGVAAGFQPETAALNFAPVTSTDPVANYAAIQAAISGSNSGATLNVAAGTYTETISAPGGDDTMLFIDKSLTLRGDPGDSQPGPGPSAPVIDGSGAVASAIHIADGINDVTIEGFEITDFRNRVGGFSDTVNFGFGGRGSAIFAWNRTTGNQRVTVRDNFMHDLGWNGVIVGNEGQVIHDSWTVTNNKVEDAACFGIELTNTSNSSITDNVITSAETEGTFVCEPGTVEGFSHPTGPYAGIFVSALSFTGGATVEPTTITIDGNTITGPFAGTGIWLRARAGGSTSGTVTLQNVTISNNTVSNSERGLWLLAIKSDSGSATVTMSGITNAGNVFNDNDDGVQIQQSGGASFSAITVTNDQLTNSADKIFGAAAYGATSGVRLCGAAGSCVKFSAATTNNTAAGSVTVFNNTIAGNAGFGVNHEGTDTLDATNNWWGDASGPGGVGPGSGDGVSTNVTFDPWLASVGMAAVPESQTVGGAVIVSATLLDSDGAEVTPSGLTARFTHTLGTAIPAQQDVAFGSPALHAYGSTGGGADTVTATVLFAGLPSGLFAAADVTWSAAVVIPISPPPEAEEEEEPEAEAEPDSSPFDTATGTTTLTAEGTGTVDLAAETTTDDEGREVARVSSAEGDLSADIPVDGLPEGTTSIEVTLQTVDPAREDVAEAIDAAGIAPADAVVLEFLVADQDGNAITDFGGEELVISIQLDPAEAEGKAVFKLVDGAAVRIPEEQITREADGTITVRITDDIVLILAEPPEEEAAPTLPTVSLNLAEGLSVIVYTGPPGSADEVFGDVVGLIAVWRLTAGDGFEGFFPGLALGAPLVLGTFDPLFLRVAAPGAVYAQPALTVTPRTVTLAAGPNLVAYTGAGGAPINVVDAALLAAVDTIWVWSDARGAWLLAYVGDAPAFLIQVSALALGDIVFLSPRTAIAWTMG